MTDLPVRAAAAPRPEQSPEAVEPRAARDRDGLFVSSGSVRVRLDTPPPPEPAPRRTLAEKLDADERERRDHIRRWARMMIVHLERADFHAPQEDYVSTLERLRELLQREIDAVHPGRAGEAA